MAAASWEVDLAEVVDPLETLQNVEDVVAGVVAGIAVVASAGAAGADEDHRSPSYLRIEVDTRFQLYGFKFRVQL